MKSSKQYRIQCAARSIPSLTGVAIAASLLSMASVSAHPNHGAETQVAAAEQNGAPASGQKSRPYVTSDAQGMMVAVDRDTGKIRALTSDEALRLADGIKALVNQSTDGLVQVQHADGSVSIDLQGRFQNAMLARKEDDGSISQACVDNPELAAVFFDIDPKLVGVLRAVSVRRAPIQLETQ